MKSGATWKTRRMTATAIAIVIAGSGLALASSILAACAEPSKAPPVTPPPVEPPPPPPPVATDTKPKPPPAPALPPSGTRTTLAEKRVDDSWDKMLVAGNRLWVLTDVNKWTSGPMYVPAARLWSMPLAGGELTRHLELEGLGSLAADDTSLYVAVNRDLSTLGTPRAKVPSGRIFRMPLGGGAAANLATAVDANVFALDGDTLWFDGSRMPKDGSKPPSPSGAKGVFAFAFDADNVYFTSGKDGGGPVKPDAKNGRISRMPKNGGAPTVIATGLPDEPGGLAVDGTHVYVAAVAWGSPAAENGGVVARVPKGGGDLEILAKDQALVRTAWLAGDHVYFRSGRPGRPGSISRVPKNGGAVETVITDSTLVSVTSDASSIYFTSDGTFREQPFQRLTPAILVRYVR